MPLLFIVGTRPEAIKIGPVVAECKRQGVPHEVLHTGQHTDLLMGTGLEPTQHCPALPTPPVGLDAAQQIDWLAEQLRWRITPFLLEGPIVVQGDTLSAYVGAELAHSWNIPLAHIEAGVRTYQPDPWPEEGYRVAIDSWADLGFCATDGNLANLRAEGGHGHYVVTGNPGVDACRRFIQPTPVSERLSQVLITLHRRESHGASLDGMVQAIDTTAAKHPGLKFIWPIHPSPEVRKSWTRVKPQHIHRIEPVPHTSFLALLADSQCVITDSGGVQEDAATLGIPCVVARDHTDRPESIDSGHAILGTRHPDTLRAAIETAFMFGGLHRDPSDCFGDGQAAPRIVAGLKGFLD